ncbi:MAG: glycosyltransferase, partial [Acidobacteria bacterium]|nr:glycosyltransferase [Acidobacteriota bacterium]
MRILQVIPFLWSGAGNVVSRLCEAQARANEVGIVTSGRSKGFTDWPEYRKRLKFAGVEHFTIDFFDRDPSVFWPSVETFQKLTREWKPDLIHCHSGVPACAAAISGSRYIAQLHSWGVGRPEWMNTMDLGGFRQADRVLCGSTAYRKTLIDGGVEPNRIRYLPWGLDISKIQQGGVSGPLPPFFRFRPIGLARRAAALPLGTGETAIVPLTTGDGREAAGGRSHI